MQTMHVATPRPSLVAAWLLLGAVVTALVTYRFVPDHHVAVRMIRALVAGGVLMGIVAGLVGAALALVFRRPAGRALVVWFLLGFTGNAVLVAALSAWFDARLLAAIERVRAMDGFVEMHGADGRIDWIARTADGGYLHTQPCAVPQLAVQAVVAIEDRRYFNRTGVLDLRALARALVAIRNGRLEGASGLAPQLGGVLLGIDTQHGSLIARLANKALKMLAGERLDDLLPRVDIASLYLSVVSFGSIPGHEIIGLCAASRAFYRSPVGDLTFEQLAELVSRLPNTRIFTPVRKLGEGDADWARRSAAIERNHAAVMRRLASVGLRDESPPAEGVRPLLATRAGLLAAITSPRLSALFAELQRLGFDPARQRLRVTTRFDQGVQEALKRAAGETLVTLTPRLAWAHHAADAVVIDATVIDEAGGILAEIGQATIPGGGSSISKPSGYAAAIDSGALPSINAFVDGVRALDAMVTSNSNVALTIARRAGPQRIYEAALKEGERPTGPFPALMLGAGIWVSPRQVAGSYVKWSPWSLGVRVTPSLAVEIVDRATGTVLYTPRRDRIFTAGTAGQIARALEQVALRGTAQVLRPLALDSPVIVKTGTAGFHRDGRWLGEGGSFAAGCDVAVRVCFAVRVRWRSGAPFEINGGQSATLVVRNLLPVLRAREKEDE